MAMTMRVSWTSPPLPRPTTPPPFLAYFHILLKNRYSMAPRKIIITPCGMSLFELSICVCFSMAFRKSLPLFIPPPVSSC